MALVAQFTKEKASNEKEKSLMEKELRSAQGLLLLIPGIIAKSKELRILQNSLDEITKLRNELDILGDQKIQVIYFKKNDALKESIHTVVQKQETQNKKAQNLIEALKKQLIDNNLTPVEPAESDQSRDSSSSQGAKEKIITEARTQALEKMQLEWKTEKNRMQKVIGNLKSEIEEYKVQMNELRDVVAAPKPSAQPEGTTKGWFKGFSGNNAGNGASLNTTASNTIPSASSETIAIPEDKPAITPVIAPVTQPQAPPTSSARSWWGSKNATSTAPTPVPVQEPRKSTVGLVNSASTEILNSDSRVKQLESEVETLKKELARLPALPDKNPADDESQKESTIKELEIKIKDLEYLQIQLKEKDLQINALEKQLSESKQDVSKIEALKVELEAMKHSIQENTNQFEKDKKSLQQLIEEGSKKIEELTDINTKLQTDIDSKNIQISSMSNDITVYQNGQNEVPGTDHIHTISNMQVEHLHKTNELKHQHSEIIAKLTAEMTHAVDEVKMNKEQLTKLSTELEESRKQFQITLDAQKQCEIQIHGLNSTLEQRNTEITSLRTNEMKLKELESQYEMNMIEKQTLITKLQELEKRMADNSDTLQKEHETNTKNNLEAELTQKNAELEALYAKEKDRQVRESALELEQKAAKQKIIDATLEIEKKNAEIASMAKKIETSKFDIENLNKQISRNKEATDFLAKSLQEQITGLLDAKSASDKKVRGEMEEKFKKEKADLDVTFKKEKADLEEKNRKSMIDNELRNTKEKVEIEEKFKKEKAKFVQDNDKLKKDMDTMKVELTKKLDTAVATKTEEINKATTRIKALEAELVVSKQDQAKSVETMNAKIAELTNSKAAAVSEEFAALQTKYDLFVQENEVLQANNERNLKALAEKEEIVKKTRAAKDEAIASEQTLKKSFHKSEKEREMLVLEIASLKVDIEAQKAAVTASQKQIEDNNQQISRKIQELEAERDGLKAEYNGALKKLEELDHENSLSGRKAAQLVSDD